MSLTDDKADHTRYDPQSLNANLARIFVKLEQIETTCVEIKAEAKNTNSRVIGLESWRDVVTAKVAGISAAVSATVGLVIWLIKTFFA